MPNIPIGLILAGAVIYGSVVGVKAGVQAVKCRVFHHCPAPPPPPAPADPSTPK